VCSIHRVKIEKVYKTDEEKMVHFKFLKSMKTGMNQGYFMNKYGVRSG
jgi:hypothetical protein